MKDSKRTTSLILIEAQFLADLQSPDADVRVKAIHSVCPCQAGWPLFETHMAAVARLKKDPNPCVRAAALHVFQDAAEMQSCGLPTHPREATDEMRRTRRRSRFRPDEDALRAAASRGQKPHKRR